MNGLSASWLAYAKGEPSRLRCLSAPLRIASSCFQALSGCRQKGYELGWLPSVRLPAPTISIGNITVGGTGKTTFASWLAGNLIAGGYKPAVILRGYGAKVSAPRVITADNQGGEEALLLAGCVPEAVIVESPTRWLGARLAIKEHGCDTVILDDGYQHRAIQRDLDIVLVDALCPWGNGNLLPAGLLRESRQALSRADAVILTRADMVETETARILLDETARFAPQAVIATAAHTPTHLLSFTDDRRIEANQLAGRRVGLCSAIGNPEAFERTMRELGAEILGYLTFRDHHHYTARDIGLICERFQETEMMVCTSKDAVKLRPLLDRTSGGKFWSLGVEWRFLSGEESVRGRIMLEMRNAECGLRNI
ncbi:MAG: tetraacyldisaccharide 4'-kinase [bacterium]